MHLTKRIKVFRHKHIKNANPLFWQILNKERTANIMYDHTVRLWGSGWSGETLYEARLLGYQG